MAKASSLDMQRSAPSMGRALGAEPVAMAMLVAVKVSEPTVTVFLPLILASSFITVTCPLASSDAMPWRSCSTTLCLRLKASAY